MTQTHIANAVPKAQRLCAAQEGHVMVAQHGHMLQGHVVTPFGVVMGDGRNLVMMEPNRIRA